MRMLVAFFDLTSPVSISENPACIAKLTIQIINKFVMGIIRKNITKNQDGGDGDEKVVQILLCHEQTIVK